MMPAVWSLCDVALVHLKDMPAFRDVIPSKMFEAMAMGLPLLLASPDGEARRILEADGAGIWVPAERWLAGSVPRRRSVHAARLLPIAEERPAPDSEDSAEPCPQPPRPRPSPTPAIAPRP